MGYELRGDNKQHIQEGEEVVMLMALFASWDIGYCTWKPFNKYKWYAYVILKKMLKDD